MSKEDKKRVQDQVLKNREKAFQDAYELPLHYPPSGDLPTSGTSTPSLWDMTEEEQERERDLISRSISELVTRFSPESNSQRESDLAETASTEKSLKNDT